MTSASTLETWNFRFGIILGHITPERERGREIEREEESDRERQREAMRRGTIKDKNLITDQTKGKGKSLIRYSSRL